MEQRFGNFSVPGGGKPNKGVPPSKKTISLLMRLHLLWQHQRILESASFRIQIWKIKKRILRNWLFLLLLRLLDLLWKRLDKIFPILMQMIMKKITRVKQFLFPPLLLLFHLILMKKNMCLFLIYQESHKMISWLFYIPLSEFSCCTK